MDEVLAVGDAAFQKKCLRKMGEVAKEGRTVLFVSHNMGAVQHLCQRGLVLDGGKVIFAGVIKEAINNYTSSLHVEARADLAERKDRSGSQWLKFIKVAFCNSDGNELRQVMSGQDVHIRLYYRSEIEKRNASVCVAFNVRNSQGHLLANLNSVDTGHDRLDIYHDGYFECRWPKFNLRSGTYYCTLFCSVNQEIVDWIPDAFIINVVDGDYYGTGKTIERQQSEIFVDHSWTCGYSSQEPYCNK